jgi:hypothetical protein
VRVAVESIPLPGVPDGLEARPVVRLRRDEQGNAVEVRDRRRRRKVDTVLLIASGPTPPPQVVADELDEAERRFVLGAVRRTWARVAAQYGDTAWEAAVRLALLGAVSIGVPVDERLRLGTPTCWRLTDPWQERRAVASAARRQARDAWTGRADEAAAAVDPGCPELAAALRRTEHAPATLPVLVYAAEDLVAGVQHDGPRAFSQAHFGDSKLRDDAAELLADAGMPGWIAERLGIVRSARLGLGGPVTVTVHDTALRLSALRGPTLIRVDQPGLTAELDEPVPLVVVENLQAAASVCDRSPALAVVYTAGQLGEEALGLVAQLAQSASAVAIVPDADLGGVRIAERLLAAAPDATVIDVGAHPHPKNRAWDPEGTAVAGLRAAQNGPAGGLARACLQRGYPVEQEAVVVRAVAQWRDERS